MNETKTPSRLGKPKKHVNIEFSALVWRKQENLTIWCPNPTMQMALITNNDKLTRAEVLAKSLAVMRIPENKAGGLYDIRII